MEDEFEAVDQQDSVKDDIANAIEELSKEDSEQEPVQEQVKEEPKEEPKEVEPAPNGWGEASKKRWAELPAEVRAEVAKREKDMHKAMTSHDGDLRFGRELREVVNPYMSIIQAEGGTPATAINALLNTAYVLRTGSPAEKKTMLLNTAKQFGVDLGVEEEYKDPALQSLEDRIAQLQKQADPASIENRLLQRIESDRIQQEIAAFASDPANTHFDKVRGMMQAIIANGQADNLKEAYDKACYADPDIRSTLEAAKKAEEEAKRKNDLASKKRAGASITGSPATPSNSKVNQKATVEDDIRAAMAELEAI